MSRSKAFGVLAGLGLSLAAGGSARAEMVADSGKLLLTGGVTNVEGVGGGGLANWAVITGYETRDAIGANVHATYVNLPDFELRTFGAGVGLYDRVELSYARQAFDTGAAGARLGLGSGFTFHQDILGVKVRVLGDAVYDQDRWRPQVAVGAQFKSNDRGAIVRAVGGKKDSGVDYYVAATKVLLNRSLVLNGTVRVTKANQFGLLGFGGDRNDDYQPQFEGTASYLFSKRLLGGVEYRGKPDNLGFARERDAFDAFVAYAVNKNLSVTAAYVDLGDIATFKDQRGLYLSIQAGF
ncbi:MAG TPA: DUF3034 family protein [Phenylobacterium sp.]|nr:DUF3034 family protein [Phenylobacterium sp.]